MGERKLLIVTMTADTELISSRLVGMPGAGISFIHDHWEFVICPQNIDIDDMCLKVFLFRIEMQGYDNFMTFT